MEMPEHLKFKSEAMKKIKSKLNHNANLLNAGQMIARNVWESQHYFSLWNGTIKEIEVIFFFIQYAETRPKVLVFLHTV